MKKILLLLLTAATFASCSIDDDGVDVAYTLVPIESASAPDTLYVGTESTIELTYSLPTNCHSFDGIIAEENDSIIYIGVQARYTTENQNCDESMGETEETSFEIEPRPRHDSYTFKFWQGQDIDGEPTYLDIIVPIKSESGEGEEGNDDDV